MYMTLMPLLFTILKIFTQLRICLHHPSPWNSLVQNIWTNTPTIHISLTPTGVRCALGIGTGIKEPRKPEKASDSCWISLVTPPSYLLLCQRQCGALWTRSLAGISLMVMFQSGWVMMKDGNVRQPLSRCRFIVGAANQGWQATLSMASIITPSSQSSKRSLKIQPMQHSSTSSHTNYNGTHHTDSMTSRYMANSSPSLHSSRWTRCFRHHQGNPIVICHTLSWHSCSGPMQLSSLLSVTLNCGHCMCSLGTNPSTEGVSQLMVYVPMLCILSQ